MSAEVKGDFGRLEPMIVLGNLRYSGRVFFPYPSAILLGMDSGPSHLGNETINFDLGKSFGNPINFQAELIFPNLKLFVIPQLFP
jgi:hypothetical protein